MRSEVRHLVDDGQTYPVVRFTGVLDADTTPEIRFALLDVLAGQPSAVVVDVSDLRLSDPAAAAVLRDLARDTADWPAARLGLCAAGNGASWHSAGLPMWRSPADAFAELGAPDPDRSRTLDLEPMVGAARRSRELIAEACARWRMEDLRSPASIVVTEMVNNVVAHARTLMEVLLARHGDTMSVAVRDRSGAAPRFSGPVAPTAYGGRGLLLIDSVSERWGNLALSGGKVVWAVLRREPALPGSGPRQDGTTLVEPA